MAQVSYTLKEFTCKGCGNTCSVQEFNVEGEKTYWGDKCSDRYPQTGQDLATATIHDLIELRKMLLDEDDAGDPPGATRTDRHPDGHVHARPAAVLADALPQVRLPRRGLRRH